VYDFEGDSMLSELSIFDHFRLVIFSNIVSILHVVRYVTSFTVYVMCL